MNIKISAALAVILCLFSCTSGNGNRPTVTDGHIRLDSDHIGKGVRLDGNWEFYWNRHALYDEIVARTVRADGYMKVPGIWRGKTVNGNPLPGHGSVSYRVTVHLPHGEFTDLALSIGSIGTAYSLFVNGSRVGGCGMIGRDQSTMTPRISNSIYPVPPVSGTFDIVLHVSNYFERNGGIWNPITLGTVTTVSRIMNVEFAFDLFICGILFIMGIYHLFMFVFRRKERGSLMFGLYCLVFSLRVALVNTRLLHVMSVVNIWPYLYKLEFMTFYAGVPIFTLLIYYLYRRVFNQHVLKAVLAISSVFIMLLIFLPTSYVSYTLTPFQLFTLMTGGYVIYVLIRSLYYSYEGAGLFLAGMIILFLTTIADIIRAQFVINIRHVSPIGFTIVLVLQSIIMAKRFSSSFNKVEKLTSDLFTTNLAYARFVPHEMLDLLNLKSINAVSLGSSVERDMTVLFADIRDFTSMSESMTPQENFNFLNSFYGRISPVIRRHGGFIDKYIGDGFIVLFPHSSDDAVKSAVDIHLEIENYNEERKRAQYRQISVGIGIHSGNIILGTIGDEERMDGTVISDTVNLASRLENLTKIGAPIIVSHTTLYTLENISNYHFRFIGEMYVKGKQNHVSVFEIFDGCSREIIDLKDRTKREFEAGITSLSRREYDLATQHFASVLEQMPDDRVARFYHDRIQFQISMPFRFHESMVELDK